MTDAAGQDSPLTIAIEPGTQTAPWEQVRDQIEARIHDGTLPVGTRLPTIRGLATELGLAANTVAKAYADLEQHGLIETARRSGSRVSAPDKSARSLAAKHADLFAGSVRGLGLAEDELLAIVREALRRA